MGDKPSDRRTDGQTGQHPVELERRCNSRTLPVNDNMMIILLGPQNVAVAAMTAAAKSPQLMYPTGKQTERERERGGERMENGAHYSAGDKRTYLGFLSFWRRKVFKHTNWEWGRRNR